MIFRLLEVIFTKWKCTPIIVHNKRKFKFAQQKKINKIRQEINL